MPEPALVNSCKKFFENHDLATTRIKQLTIDPNISERLRTAASLLYDALINTSESSNSERWRHSEEIAISVMESAEAPLLKAKAHVIVSALSHSRKEYEVSAVNLARAFSLSPGWARTILYEVFKEVFLPECEDLYEAFKAEEGNLIKDSHTVSVWARRGAAIAVGAGVGAAAIGVALFMRGNGNLGGFNGVIQQALAGSAGPIWDSATPDRVRAAKLDRLRSDLELRVDERCKRAAVTMM